MKNEKNKKIKNCNIVSFDIYDTLIERILPVVKIHQLLSKKYKINNFCNLRKEAEIKAKKQYSFGYTIYNIYEFINIKENIKEKILEDEIRYEIKNTKKNMVGERLYENLKNENTIICISDMYFSKDIIQEILLKNGYDQISDIFISCNYKASKRNKKLFKIVKRKYKNYKITHIGDSIRSDFINAILSGFKVNFIKKNNIVNNSKVLSKKEYLYYMGYHVFGPMIFEFCTWINSKLVGNCNLLFLSREGELLRTCYNKLYDDAKDIFYVSRKSVINGILYTAIKNNEVDKLIASIKSGTPEKIKDLLNRLNLLEYTNIFDSSFINCDVNDYSICELQNIIYNNKKMMIKKLYKNSQIFQKYVSSKINDSTVFVDVGWNGSMQNLFNDYYLKNNQHINGLYLGCLNSKNKDGFLFKEKSKSSYNILNYSGILELIFMPDYGTVLNYKYDNKHIVPVFNSNEFSNESKLTIKCIQNGYLDYITDRKKISSYSLYCPNEIISMINKIGLTPTKYDLEYLGNIDFYDNGKSNKVLNFKNGIYNGFCESKWKTGYLKKLFKLRLPYGSILNQIRRAKEKI